MSAIIGIFSLDGKDRRDDGINMMKKMNVAKVHTSDLVYNGDIIFGCHLQLITPESRYERIPYHDGPCRLIITADAIIDNRQELLNAFSVAERLRDSITDSQLILLAYKKWGQRCPQYLVGDFAFAVFDEKKKELFCARDQVGKRTLYFYYDKKTFAFCTLMRPLLDLSESRNHLNDTWITDFISFGTPIHEVDSNTTVYKNIYQLLPAHTLKVSSDGISKKQYWTSMKAPKLKYKTDEEFEAGLMKVFTEAVKCRLRSSGDIGVMLSGGIDSGSVACIAGKLLNEEKKILKGYSSIPSTSFQNDYDNRYIPDESEYIEEIIKVIPNIKHTYCRFEEKNSITDIDSHIRMLEQPYKTVENCYWISGMTSLAADEGCTVMLEGQYGNMTVSFGEIMVQLCTLFKRGRWVACMKEMKAFSGVMNYRLKGVIRAFFEEIAPKPLVWLYHKLRGIKKAKPFIAANKYLLKRYHTVRRFKRLGVEPFFKTGYSLKQTKKYMAKPLAFSQIGMFNTKMSLEYGIQFRDPCMDKRVIEYCSRIPASQFVRNGEERSLIRRAMKGILPDKIRLNYRSRGMQSADWVQRLKPHWSEIKKAIRGMLGNGQLAYYVDKQLVASQINKMGDDIGKKEISIFRRLIVCLILGKFLEVQGPDQGMHIV